MTVTVEVKYSALHRFLWPVVQFIADRLVEAARKMYGLGARSRDHERWRQGTELLACRLLGVIAKEVVH